MSTIWSRLLQMLQQQRFRENFFFFALKKDLRCRKRKSGFDWKHNFITPKKYGMEMIGKFLLHFFDVPIFPLTLDLSPFISILGKKTLSESKKNLVFLCFPIFLPSYSNRYLRVEVYYLSLPMGTLHPWSEYYCKLVV